MKKLFLFTLTLCLLFTSCQNKKRNYYDGFEKSETGLFYKFYTQNEGDTPNLNDLVELTISCSVNDSIILPSHRNIIKVEPMFKGDLSQGLLMMHVGDSASFIVRTDSTFYTLFNEQTIPDGFSNDDVMRFDVSVNDFYSEAEMQRKQYEYMLKYIEGIKTKFPQETIQSELELNRYLNDNKINVTHTESGLCYVKTKDGNGEYPLPGMEVNVHYTGKLLNGTVFDTSLGGDPFKFILGARRVILGWDEGIQLMSKGEKGIFYIPYYLGYGDRGTGIIPPFATLVFEVELVEF